MLSIAIVLEGFSLRTAVVESNAARGNASWAAFVRRSRSPELPVVLPQGLGAMVGLGLALAALVVAEVADAPVWDGIGTLSIGVLLGLIAVVLAVEMKSLLIGEGATALVRAQIVAVIENGSGVERLIHVRTQHLGPDELLVAAKVAFDPSFSTEPLGDAINTLEASVREQVPQARPMYIEPDVYRGR